MRKSDYIDMHPKTELAKKLKAAYPDSDPEIFVSAGRICMSLGSNLKRLLREYNSTVYVVGAKARGYRGKRHFAVIVGAQS